MVVDSTARWAALTAVVVASIDGAAVAGTSRALAVAGDGLRVVVAVGVLDLATALAANVLLWPWVRGAPGRAAGVVVAAVGCRAGLAASGGGWEVAVGAAALAFASWTVAANVRLHAKERPPPWGIAACSFAAALAVGAWQAGPPRSPDGVGLLVLTTSRGVDLKHVPGAIALVDVAAPSTDLRAAAASLFTGHHPLRHRVGLDRDRPAAGLEDLFDAVGPSVAWLAQPDVSGLGLGVDLEVGARTSPAPDLERVFPWVAWRRAGPTTDDVEAAVDSLVAASPGTSIWAHVGEDAAAAARIASRWPLDAPLLAVALSGPGSTPTEGDVRRRAWLRAPSLAPDGLLDTPVRLTDLGVTLAAVAGHPFEARTEGVNLRSWIRGETVAPLATAILGADAAGPWFAYRATGAKYVLRAGVDEVWRLEDEGVAVMDAGVLEAAREVAAAERAAWEAR